MVYKIYEDNECLKRNTVMRITVHFYHVDPIEDP